MNTAEAITRALMTAGVGDDDVWYGVAGTDAWRGVVAPHLILGEPVVEHRLRRMRRQPGERS